MVRALEVALQKKILWASMVNMLNKGVLYWPRRAGKSTMYQAAEGSITIDMLKKAKTIMKEAITPRLELDFDGLQIVGTQRRW